MIYTIANNIRVKSCDDISFFININDNSVFCIKTDTLKFLTQVLDNKLTKKKLDTYNADFINFVLNLENQKILEVI